MNDWDRAIEFLFRLKEIDLKQQEINNRQNTLRNAQFTQQPPFEAQITSSKQILEAQITSSQQTLEVIKLTNIIIVLTIALVIIGLIQIAIMLIKP